MVAGWDRMRCLPGDTIDDYTAGFVGWRSTWMLAEAGEEECADGAEAEAAKSEYLAAVTAAVQTDALARAREEGE